MRVLTRRPYRRILIALVCSAPLAAALPAGGAASSSSSSGPAPARGAAAGSGGSEQAAAARRRKHCPPGTVRRGIRCVKRTPPDPYAGNWADPRGNNPDSGVSAGLIVSKTKVKINIRLTPECAQQTGNGYLGFSGDAPRHGNSFSTSYNSNNATGYVATVSGSFSSHTRGSGSVSITQNTSVDRYGNGTKPCSGQAQLKFVR
jgi:hypothetical protein